MRNLISISLLLVLIIMLPVLSIAQDEVAITVTNSNLGLIREVRSVPMDKGLQTIYLEDIPTGINPGSVLIESANQSFSVLEQNYEYDLISVDKILDKSLNQEIRIIHPDQGVIDGKLLSATPSNMILIDGGGQMQIIPRNGEQKIFLKEYSKTKTNFITRPTLVWKVNSESKGDKKTLLSYLSSGLDWQADYVAKLNENDTEVMLASWVTINNTSGKAYKNARLKLMAGDINLVSDRRAYPERSMVKMMARDADAFVEKEFFEYHLYSLQRLTDLEQNQIKQIQLFPETKSNVQKIYRVDSAGEISVSVFVILKNSKENNLGFALPAGTIRLYKADGNELEFVGENRIKHTPKDEKLEIEVGKAFDVVAERDVLETQRREKRSQTQKISYTLRNHKNTDIELEILERVNPYQEVELVSSNYKLFEKKANFLKFKIPVKAGEESSLTMEYISRW
ncbi:MAG: DUF4139 domain-containing protein [Calditrichaceae bacterium]